MTRKDHSLLSIFLCLALVITILPLIGAVEPASAASGYIHGTVKSSSGTPLADIPVVVWRRDGGLLVVPKTNSQGYFNTGTIDDPGNRGFQVNANKHDQGDRNRDYQEQEKGPYYLGNPSGTVVNFYLPRFIDTSKVTFSGTVVADVGSTPLPVIEVYLWRHDGKSWKATSGSDGKWSATVDRSSSTSNPDHRINVIANPSGSGHTPNAAWFNSTEQVNILPDRDRTLSFRLPTAKVTFSGRVTDETTGKGVNGLEIFLWRHDNGESVYARTQNIGGYDGKWSIQVSRAVSRSNPDQRFNIMANKNNAGHYNPAYFNSTERVNILPDRDQPSLDFRVLSGTVRFDSLVKDQKTGLPVSGIEVFLWRHDGKSWKVTTGSDGKWSAMVDRSSSTSNPDHRINIIANKYGSGFNPNTGYLNSTEQVNKLPDRDQSLPYFYLYSSTVKFDGLVKDQKTGAALPGIEVYLWRHDGKSWKVTTGSDGKWSQMVDRSSSTSNPDHRINVIANPYGSGHTPNTAYLNSTEIVNKLPDRDQSLSYFYLYSSTVLFSGNVSDDRTRAGISNIGVQLKRNSDGNTICVRTDSRGMWKASVPRSSDTNHKYTVTANPSGACTPWNAGYSTSPPTTSGTPDYNQVYNFYVKAVATPVPTTPTVTPTPNPTPPVTPTPTPSPDHTRFTVVAAEMVSPEELGVAVKATYPAWIRQDTARTVTIQATINGRYVAKTIPVTQYTSPGSEWDDTTMSGTFRVKPTTPIRINLREAGVPRFTDDVSFTVSGTASYAGGLPSRSSSTTADVRLPVLAYHGYNYPNGLRATVLGITLPDEISWIVAYKGFSDYLTGNWKYNRDSDWGITWKIPLELKGYTDDRYVTLWDAEDSHLTYTNPLRTAPPQLRDDVQAAVDRAKAHSYADRVNLVGHSFGGLLSRYYASERPQYVNKVVTVGSPMQGVTFAYQTIFTEEAKNRGEVVDNLTVHEGSYAGQPCALYWGIPKYSAVILPANPPSGINTAFTSTYSAPIRSGVDYHFIYATNHADTPYKVTLALNPNGQWYHVASTSTTAGDGTVITSSGGDIGGASGTNVHRHAVVIPEDHSHILNSGVVKDTIIQAVLDIPAGSM